MKKKLFYIIFSISNLPPNQMFQLWAFFPNGKAIGGSGFSSNINGSKSDFEN
jgi:hypothetical protein